MTDAKGPACSGALRESVAGEPDHMAFIVCSIQVR